MVSVSGPERTTAPLVLLADPDRPSREHERPSSHTPSVYLWSENPWRSAARSKFHPSPCPLFASSRQLIHLRGGRPSFSGWRRPGCRCEPAPSTEAPPSGKAIKRTCCVTRGWSTLTGHGGDAPSGGPELVPCWSPHDTRRAARHE